MGSFDQILLCGLVFAAVAWGVWVVTPLLAAVGLERSVGKYVKSERADFDPLYRFTTPERLGQSCWAVALLSGGLAITVLLFASIENAILLVLFGLITGAISFRIPKTIIKARIRRRNLVFQTRLVDVTVGLANGLRAGAALPQALDAITKDIGGPVGEEFNILLHEHHLGTDLSECLARLGKRMPGEDLQLLITAVRLTLQSGGSLAEVLDKITNTIRQRVEFHEKLRTLTAQGRFEAIAMASAPLVAFLILYAIDPALMKLLITTRGGWIAIGVVAVLETIGFFWINRIVNVEA
jgi:tight adherence protein B